MKRTILVPGLLVAFSFPVGCSDSDPTGNGETTGPSHEGATVDSTGDQNSIDVENGVWTDWYDNGEKKEEGRLEGGVKTGLWTFWHENGQKWKEGEFKNGKHEGLWTSWRDNGQKSGEGSHRNGKPEGTVISWKRDGSVNTVWSGIYRNGKKVSELP